jgi:phosphinothricin acetyltransferase
MIRIAQESDASALLDIYAPFVTDTAVTFEVEVPTLEAFIKKMKEIKAEAPYLVYEHEGEVLGYAYASSHRQRAAYRWTRELSVYIREDAKSKKCGTGLYTSLLELLRCQNYRTALAGITLPNIPSVNFHERLGFYPVGVYDNIGFKLGKSHRVGWWQLMLQEPQEPAQEIIGIEEVLSTEKGQQALKRGEARILI